MLCGALARDGSIGHVGRMAEVLSDPNRIAALIQEARRERVLPALHAAVASRYAAIVPKPYRAVLATEYEANRRRNEALHAALVELAQAARTRGIEIVALKGIAWVVEDPSGFAGWRTMRDVDILINETHAGAMAEIVSDLGYQAVERPHRWFGTRQFRNHFHLIPYTHASVPALFEIHKHLGWRHNLLPVATVFRHAGRGRDGILLPAPWCRAFHAIIHWQVQEGGYSRANMPLPDMLDVARFLDRDDVDWAAIVNQARVSGTRKQCEAAIALASKQLGAPVPPAFVLSANAARHVPRAVMRRAVPERTRFATDLWRVGRLWRLEKDAYRLFARGAPQPVIPAIISMQRIILLPMLVVRMIGVAVGELGRQLRSYRIDRP